MPTIIGVSSHASLSLSAIGNYQVAVGDGEWFSVIFGGSGTQRIKVYDGVDNAGRLLASFDTKSFIGTVEVQVIFKQGLFVEMLTAFDCTIVYFSTTEPPQS